MVKIEEKEKINICKCLYDTIIDEQDYCMWKDEIDYQPSDLDFVGELRYEVAIWDMSEDEDGEYEEHDIYVGNRYERLCLLNNQQITIGGRQYTKVIKIMDGCRVEKWIDLLKVEEFQDVSVWSNGALNWEDQRFYIYWRGMNIANRGCPPSMTELINAIISSAMNDRVETYAPELIEKAKLLKTLRYLTRKTRDFIGCLDNEIIQELYESELNE